MLIVFRADASMRIGFGHVMRCLTLAKSMRDAGAIVSFVCREHEGHLCNLIASEGLVVHRLPQSAARTSADQSTTPAEWLGASWEEDAAQTRAAFASLRATPDWIVVDHYAIDHRWERALRPFAHRIMVIDDLADRSHECDALLDQNFVTAMTERYAGKVPRECQMLLGPDYALLQSEYTHLHDQVRFREGPIRRVLIYFGGADQANITGRVLAAFLNLGRDDIRADVVVRADGQHVSAIRHLATGRQNVTVHDSLPTLAALMADADLGVGAAGASTWERCCLGLPSLVITLADNQRPIAAALHESGVVRWLGDLKNVDESQIAVALRHTLDGGLDPRWSKRCWTLVDGRGTHRVRAIMTEMPNSANELKIRRAVPEDAELLLMWRNDPEVLAASRVSSPVSLAEHSRWLESVMGNPDRALYIAEFDGRPAGTVRVDRHSDGQELSWTVAPPARGKGIGKAMVRMVSDTLAGVVYAEVKPGNAASAAIAIHAGMTLEGEREGMQRYVRRA
jgi:UDP-2,4-diacetamido-2,4,6-trideoxy-beta-L-altropyranose hydrolase